MHPKSVSGIALAAFIASASSGLAQPPDDAKGRFALSPVPGGVVRLDKETGEMSLCAERAQKWICEPVEDRGNQGAGDKLEAENRELRARIKALEDQVATPDAGPPAPKAQLPTEEEVDKALDYVETIFKKFRDRIRKYEEPAAPAQPPPPDTKDDKQL